MRPRDDGAVREAGTVRGGGRARPCGGPAARGFVAPDRYDSFAFAVDPSGRLAWEPNEIDGDHALALLSERVSDEYLAFLRGRGLSYLLAGAHDVGLAVALEKIGERLGVRTLMLEGGGRINGGMLRAGLVDEVSLLIAPVADGRIGTPALFDVGPAAAGAPRVADADDLSLRSGQVNNTPRRLAIEAVERRADDVLWLRYRVEAETT